jgi:predicted nucleic acid-binding protein
MSRNAPQSEELKLLGDVARAVYQLEPMNAADIAGATTIIERYADLRLGLADASIVVLAERYGCHDILTLDERHFRAVTGSSGQPFRLFPADLA